MRSALSGGIVAALLVTAVPAIADVGDALLAGRFNTVDKKTSISGDAAADSIVKFANGAADGTGVTIQIEPGNPPLVVTSGKRVKKLNADRLDGFDADDFALKGEPGISASGQIRADGTIRSSSTAVASVSTPATGAYCIEFATPIPSDRLEMAVVGGAGGTPTAVFPRVINGQAAATTCPADTLHIEINDATGTLVNARFSFVVP